MDGGLLIYALDVHGKIVSVDDVPYGMFSVVMKSGDKNTISLFRG